MIFHFIGRGHNKSLTILFLHKLLEYVFLASFLNICKDIGTKLVYSSIKILVQVLKNLESSGWYYLRLWDDTRLLLDNDLHKDTSKGHKKGWKSTHFEVHVSP